MVRVGLGLVRVEHLTARRAEVEELAGAENLSRLVAEELVRWEVGHDDPFLSVSTSLAEATSQIVHLVSI